MSGTSSPATEAKLRSLRILMYSTYFPPQYSGAAKQAISLAQHLQGRGHHVEFATVRWPGTTARDTVGGFAVHRLEQGSGERHRELKLWLSLLRFASARKKDFDIVHSHGAYYTNSAVGPLARLMGWKSLAKASLAENDLFGIDRSLSGRIHGAFLRSVDACIAISSDLVREFQAAGIASQRVHFIPNGVDTERFHPADSVERLALRKELSLPLDRPLAIAPGVLDERKNIGWLMQEWVDQRAFGTNALLIALGPQSREDIDGNHINRLRKLAAQHPDLIRLDGYDPEIERYYHAADLLVLPSLSEGMPNVVLEAMASGIPCVTTWVSGAKELVIDGQTGYHFASGNGAELGEAVRKTIPVAKMMGAKARERMLNHYSIHALATRYEDLYRQLLSKA